MVHFQYLHIGTAGWQLAKGTLRTDDMGTHLERYGRTFNATEINSTFYRPHRAKTFERWAASVPENFRFAVKMHKGITHEKRLTDIRPAQVFLDMISALGEKLGPVLVQLPPSLSWSTEAEAFLSAFREVYSGDLAVEARHPSWGARKVGRVLRDLAIAGVAADPPRITEELEPTGRDDLLYFRLHGSPQIYRSAYTHHFLLALANRIVALLATGRRVWVIFDNTGSDAATSNALQMQKLMAHVGNP